MYKGEVFHVQTEDSGIANPHIITLLYRGGVIITSKKTSYADILKIENLEALVEELMKEQHKELMRRLKSGEFDEKAFSFTAHLLENYEIPTLEPEEKSPTEIIASKPVFPESSQRDVSLLFERPHSNTAVLQAKTEIKPETKGKSVNLDEEVIAFFSSREK